MRRICLFISLAMTLLIFQMLPLKAVAAVYSGSCGEGVTWDYDEDSHILSIYGDGELDLYSGNGVYQPWHYFKDNITEVSFSGNITHIGGYAFRDCTRLESIDIPDSVASIGEQAFSGCTSLGRVIIRNASCSFSSSGSVFDRGTVLFSHPNSAVEEYAKKHKLGFVGHVFENGVCIDCGESMNNCDIHEKYQNGIEVLWTLNIGSGELTLSGNGEMLGESSPEQVIPWYPYNRIITSAKVEPGITKLGIYTFWGCSSVKSVYLSEGLLEIGQGVFANCSNLQQIELPSSVSVLGVSAFGYCSSLHSITIPDNIRIIGERAFNHSGLVGILIPDNTTIGPACFDNCALLEQVSVGKSCEISVDAFSNCSELEKLQLSDVMPSDLIAQLTPAAELTVYYPEGAASWENATTPNSSISFSPYNPGNPTVNANEIQTLVYDVEHPEETDKSPMLEALQDAANRVPGRFVSKSGDPVETEAETETETETEPTMTDAEPKQPSPPKAVPYPLIISGAIFVLCLAGWVIVHVKNRVRREQ